jgi:heme exporter protein D
MFWAMGLGLVIIAVSAGYIVVHLRGLRQQRQQREVLQSQAQSKAREQRQYLIDSIRVIARAMSEDEKMTLTEGSIRLKVLLDNLMPELHSNPDFEIIATHYEATRHIPYLKAWKSLERSQQRRYRKEMDTLEQRHRDALLQAAAKLQQYPLDRMH